MLAYHLAQSIKACYALPAGDAKAIKRSKVKPNRELSLF